MFQLRMKTPDSSTTHTVEMCAEHRSHEKVEVMMSGMSQTREIVSALFNMMQEQGVTLRYDISLVDTDTDLEVFGAYYNPEAMS